MNVDNIVDKIGVFNTAFANGGFLRHSGGGKWCFFCPEANKFVPLWVKKQHEARYSRNRRYTFICR